MRLERDQWKRESNQLFDAMFRQNTAPKLLIEADSGQIIDANESALSFYGYSRSAIERLNIRDINPLDDAALRRELQLAQREERRFFRFQHRLANGELRDVEVYSSPMTRHGCQLLHSIIHDVTERTRAEAELAAQKAEYRLMAAAFHTGQGVMIVDRQQIIERVNDAFTAITGYTLQAAVGQPPQLLQSDQHDATFYQRVQFTLSVSGYWEGEYWYRHQNGETLPLWQSISTLTNGQGEIEHYIYVFHDIRKQKILEEELKHLAEHDRLTGICNRTRLYRLQEQAINDLERYDTPFSLIMLDIDCFKDINDEYGHDVGDSVLKALTDVIIRQLRDSDEVGRWGGDEFMLLAGHTHLDGAITLAERVRASIEATTFDDIGSVTVSLGVVEFHRGMTLAESGKAVDEALYRAKRRGRNRVESLPGDA
ncbi:MAG: diguanylate cyclase [Onishia taeanensis]|uniref:sensor domain-containing diguanylate cyclase n=1 Tax=Onishia taeanensis TaxID=284577 RepID=UPI003C7A2FEA